MKINLTEKDVFFGLCKAIRVKQEEAKILNFTTNERTTVTFGQIVYGTDKVINLQTSDVINQRQLFALLHKLIEKKMIRKIKVKKKIKAGWVDINHFELDVAGIEYINKIKKNK